MLNALVTPYTLTTTPPEVFIDTMQPLLYELTSENNQLSRQLVSACNNYDRKGADEIQFQLQRNFSQILTLRRQIHDARAALHQEDASYFEYPNY